MFTRLISKLLSLRERVRVRGEKRRTQIVVGVVLMVSVLFFSIWL
jgi:hypothetical protein